MQTEGMELGGALLPDGQQGAAGTAGRLEKAGLRLRVFAGAKRTPLKHRNALKGKTRGSGWASSGGS